MEKGKNLKYRTAEQEEMRKFLIVVIVVALLVVGIYFLTRAIVTKDLFKKEETTEAEKVEVNYEVAIVGEILNRPYDEYYVVVYDETKEKASEMSGLVSEYKGTEKPLHVYTVYLNNKINEKYYNPEKENTKATTVKEFAFGDSTLIKVNKGKVEKYITDYTKMQKELGLVK